MTDGKITGAKALIECLKAEGVDIIFGYPGGVLLPIYDELYECDIRHILVRHEQAAAHAADGYARATGKVGVCLATSGPGATNIVTGVATAYMDSVPMVALTGQVPTAMIGNDAFQEADITGITLPITKHNYLVSDVEDLPRIIKESFHIAGTGRPGPVLVDIPKDVTVNELDFKYPNSVNLHGYNPHVELDTEAIQKAVTLIAQAKRPVMYVGGGVVIADANKELLEFVETIQAPVTTTLMGIGAFPESHPLSIKMLGMHGTKYANFAIQESDLLITVGARFDDRVTGKIESFAPNAKIIHIDIDPAEISKNICVDIPIIGDAKEVLSALTESVIKDNKQPDTTEWTATIAKWKKEHPLTYKNQINKNQSKADKQNKEQNNNISIMPQSVVEMICEICPDAIITTEVGQNQMWAAQYFKYEKPRTFISSGGLGTMGYGMPAAMGAKLGCPDKTVINIAGDGSFQMNSQELATLVQDDVAVINVILNNGVLGMVRQWQDLFFDQRFSHTTIKGSVDFVKLAEAYGALGIRVTKPEEIRPAIEKAIESNRPTVIDVIVMTGENVYPMVPAGASISEMLEGDI
ncbi:MAG: acetolactate synthase large subunit [Methanosarcinales archaeon]|nr:acetolactate synthase large subunit [Methanosarcinales archaeon]